MYKKSQVTVFLALSIILLMAFGLAFYVKNMAEEVQGDTYDNIHGDTLTLQGYVESCMKKVIDEHYSTAGPNMPAYMNFYLRQCLDYDNLPGIEVTDSPDVFTDIQVAEDGKSMQVEVDYEVIGRTSEAEFKHDEFYVNYPFTVDRNLNPNGESVLWSNDGRAELVVPSGSTNLDSISVDMVDINNLPARLKPYEAFFNDMDIVGKIAYSLGPDGSSFSSPLTLKIHYDDSFIPEHLEPAIMIGYLNHQKGVWTYMRTSVDTVNNIASAKVNHFSDWAAHVHPGADCGGQINMREFRDDTPGVDDQPNEWPYMCFKSDGAFKKLDGEIVPNYYAAGTLCVQSEHEMGRQYEDQCSLQDSTQLVEYFCSDDASAVFDAAVVSCRGNGVCDNGECTQKPPCYKTDWPVDLDGNNIKNEVHGGDYYNRVIQGTAVMAGEREITDMCGDYDRCPEQGLNWCYFTQNRFNRNRDCSYEGAEDDGCTEKCGTGDEADITPCEPGFSKDGECQSCYCLDPDANVLNEAVCWRGMAMYANCEINRFDILAKDGEACGCNDGTCGVFSCGSCDPNYDGPTEVTNPMGCTDRDGGANAAIGSYVYIEGMEEGTGKRKDYCSGNTLFEAVCDDSSDLKYGFKKIHCEKGCDVNKCIVDQPKANNISKLCRRFTDDEVGGGELPWKCVLFGEELNTPFPNIVDGSTTLSLMVDPDPRSLGSACKLCSRFIDDNLGYDSKMKCVNFGDELEINFSGVVDENTELQVKFACGSGLLPQHKICRQYVDTDNAIDTGWECASIDTALETDFNGIVDESTKLNFMIKAGS